MEVAEKDNTEGRCPACRTPYDKEKIVGMTVNCERLTDASFDKRQKSQKSKSKASEMRKHLSNVRVIQRNLVYIIGIPSHLADEETLERREFFGQYGKVLKVSISRSNASNQHSSSNPTSSVYITYTKEEEAIRCIQAVNGYVLDGRPLRACFGTTKYCHAWLKNMPCNNPDCLYLHDIGTQEDSFTKEEMVSTCASKIPQFHGSTNPSQRRGGSYLPPPEPEVSSTNSASSSKLSVKIAAANVGGQARTSIVNGTTGKATALPAAASWGLRAAQGRTLPQKTPVIPVSTKLKSSSSHTMSVSPPSNLPTSAAVVAAAVAASTPVLHSDHCKPSLAVVGNHGSQASQRLPSFVLSKQNVKNQQTRTTLTNSMGADSSVISTISDKHMRQVSPEKNTSEGNSEQKQGVYEEIERTSPNTLPKSALPGKSHVEECVETDKIDNLSASSGLADKRLCHEGLQTVLCNHDDVSTSVLNENSSFHSAVHSSKPPLDEPAFSPNISDRENMSCLETSMVETTEGASIAKAEKLCNSNDPEEELSASEVQMLPETGRTKHDEFAFDGNNRSFNSRESSSTAAVCSPHHVAMPKDDLSRGLPVGTPNMVVLDSSDCKTGMADDRTEASSCSRMDDSSCPMPLSQECGMAKEDGFSRESALATEQTSEGQFKSAKSQSLDGHQNDKLLNKDNNDTIAGENSIISDILSMDFEILAEDSVASPHNLAKVLLGEKDRTMGFSKDISSSRKIQSSGQSRFSFAREEESSRELSHFSNSLRTNGQLQNTVSRGKESLDNRNGYDRLNRLKNDTNACDRDEYQILTNKNTSPNPGSAVVPLPVSRSQFSAPPGFSIPTRPLTVPPPGFPQPRVDRPYESTTSVFANGTKDHDESLSLQNTVPNTYGSVHQTLGSNGCGDVELIDPAIMAVGRGKLPVGQSQHGSPGLPRQDLSNLSYSPSFLGLRTPFSQQLSPIDYDARHQMLNPKSLYTNASLTSPRQPLKFQDAVGEAFTSYLSCQNDTMIQSMMIDQSQMNVDPSFSQLSFQQPTISTYRSSSVCANGWDNWNRISPTLEPGLGERRLEATLTEYANKERMLDPRSGLSKIFPSYGESMFHMPSAENYYSRPFEM